jgi:hypothetical protein
MYRLSAGNYTITSTVQPTVTPGDLPTTVCYVGASSDVVTINLPLSAPAFDLRSPGVRLGLQGLALDGQGRAKAVVVSNSAAFAANQVTFSGCPSGAVVATGGAGSVVLTSVTVTACGNSANPAVVMDSTVSSVWSNVSGDSVANATVATLHVQA